MTGMKERLNQTSSCHCGLASREPTWFWRDWAPARPLQLPLHWLLLHAHIINQKSEVRQKFVPKRSGYDGFFIQKVPAGNQEIMT